MQLLVESRDTRGALADRSTTPHSGDVIKISRVLPVMAGAGGRTTTRDCAGWRCVSTSARLGIQCGSDADFALSCSISGAALTLTSG